MGTKAENEAIQRLNTDTAVMKSDIKYLIRAIDDLKKDFKDKKTVPVEDFVELRARVTKLEEYNDANKLGTVFSNLFASKAFTFVIALIFAAIIFYATRTGGR